MDNREKIAKEISAAGFPKKEVAIPFDQFFTGNNDLGSIGVNLSPQPSPGEFYDIFKQIKASPRTENIFVRITDTDTDWFYSDAVYIIGDWTKDELSKILKKLRPDEIHEGWMYDKPTNIVHRTQKVYTIWWD